MRGRRRAADPGGEQRPDADEDTRKRRGVGTRHVVAGLAACAILVAAVSRHASQPLLRGAQQADTVTTIHIDAPPVPGPHASAVAADPVLGPHANALRAAAPGADARPTPTIPGPHAPLPPPPPTTATVLLNISPVDPAGRGARLKAISESWAEPLRRLPLRLRVLGGTELEQLGLPVSELYIVPASLTSAVSCGGKWGARPLGH